jgi:hypothetical protein
MRFKTWMAAAVVAATVAVTACSDDGGSKSGSSTTDSDGDNEEQAPDPTELACASLDGAEIEAAFGGPVGPASAVGDGICQWSIGAQQPGAVGSAVVLVSVDSGRKHPDRAFAKVRGSIPDPVEVDGVGDSAFYSSGDTAMYVRAGDVIFVVQYFRATPSDPDDPQPPPDQQANLTSLSQSIVTSLESPRTDLGPDTNA